MSKPSSLVKKTGKAVLLFVGMLIALFALTRLGVGLAGTRPEQFALLESIATSPLLIVIRLCVYVLLFIYWSALLRRYNPSLSDAFIKASRRPLVILIVLYELVIVRDWQSWFSALIG
jgi:hypothetical protein